MPKIGKPTTAPSPFISLNGIKAWMVQDEKAPYKIQKFIAEVDGVKKEFAVNQKSYDLIEAFTKMEKFFDTKIK